MPVKNDTEGILQRIISQTCICNISGEWKSFTYFISWLLKTKIPLRFSHMTPSFNFHELVQNSTIYDNICFPWCSKFLIPSVKIFKNYTILLFVSFKSFRGIKTYDNSENLAETRLFSLFLLPPRNLKHNNSLHLELLKWFLCFHFCSP